MIALTAEERGRFAAYLEAEAASNEQLIKQMDIALGIPPALVSQYRAEMMACKLVAAKLRSTEAQESS